MRIAVTYENGQIFQHFGHTEQFKVYDLEDNKIVNTQVVDTNGQGHGALAGFLNSTDIDVLICVSGKPVPFPGTEFSGWSQPQRDNTYMNMDKNNVKPYVFKHPEYEWRVFLINNISF